MRHRVVLPLVLLIVAGCGGAEPTVSVPGAATSLATTTWLEAGDALLAATVDAAGAPVMVVDDGGTSPVLRRGRDTGTGTVVGLVGTSAVQSIWAISVAPDDSVVMIADGHSGTAVVRVDPAGSMTRYPVDLHTDPARTYGSRHPMRTYAALTADASTAVLLTVPEQPRTSVTDGPQATGQVELHRVDTTSGERTAFSTTQLPGPGPFDVLGLAVSPDGDLVTVAAAVATDGAESGASVDVTALDAILMRFDAGLRSVDRIPLAREVMTGGGMPLDIDDSGTAYTVVTGRDGTGEWGPRLLAVTRNATEATVVAGLGLLDEESPLGVDRRGRFAYLPGWWSARGLGVTVVDLRDGSTAAQVPLCDRGFLGGPAALAADGSRLLVSGTCSTVDEAESGEPSPSTLLVLR